MAPVGRVRMCRGRGVAERPQRVCHQRAYLGTSQVLYYINPRNNSVSESAALAAIQTAAQTWSAQSLATIQLVYAGYTGGSALSLNSKNEVFFRNEAGAGGETDPGRTRVGTFGRSRTSSSARGRPGSRSSPVRRGARGAAFTWKISAPMNSATCSGFEHHPSTTATMTGIMPGYCITSHRTLDPDDIAGIEYLYPPSGVSPPPVTPTQLFVSTDSLHATSGLVLNWSDNATNETGYRVERSTNGASFALVAALGKNVTSFADGGLISGPWTTTVSTPTTAVGAPDTRTWRLAKRKGLAERIAGRHAGVSGEPDRGCRGWSPDDRPRSNDFAQQHPGRRRVGDEASLDGRHHLRLWPREYLVEVDGGELDVCRTDPAWRIDGARTLGNLRRRD